MSTEIKRKIRQAVAMTLSAVMLLSAVTGCARQSGNDSQPGDGSGKEETAQAQATYVSWDKSGSYTTTLTAEGKDLGGVKAEDVFIGNSSVDYEAYKKAAGEAPSEAEAPDIEDYTEKVPCKVTKVEEKDGGLAISFEDADAPKKETGSYNLVIEEKGISTPVIVDYPMPEMTADVEGVLVTDEAPEITLTLKDGLFAETVTADQISLAGAFSGMEVETAEAESNQLHLKLKGKTESPEEQGPSVDGIISLTASAMEQEHSPASVRIPVLESLVSFDSSAMTAEGEQVTAPLTVIGGKDVSTLTPSDITFPEDEMTAAAAEDADSAGEDSAADGTDGSAETGSSAAADSTDSAARQPEEQPAITVTKVEKQDDTHVLVTMTIEGATDKNTAAAALDGRTVQVGDVRTAAGFHGASFYPFFDYVEEDGEDLKLQIKLMAQAGVFAKDADVSQVSFGGGLSEAEGVSLERQDDTTAMLTVTVPANGQTKEKFSYNGTVTLAAGAMVNPWGDASDSPVEYTRSYSQETLGRPVNLANLATYQSLARGLGIAGKGLMGAGIAFAVVTMALEMSGIVKTAAQQAMEINQQINKNLDIIFEQLSMNNQVINDIEDQLLWQRVNDFNVQLAMVNTYTQKLQWFYQPEKLKLLGYEPIEINEEESDSVKVEKMRKMQEISKAVANAEYDRDSRIALEFRNYYDTYNTLQKYYSNVCAMLSSTGDTNPVNTFIRLTSRNTNFDTQTFETRKSYIDAIESALLLALSAMSTYNLRSTTINDDNTVKLRTVMKVADDNFTRVTGELDKLVDAMDARVEEKTDDAVYYDSAYCYTFGMMVEDLDTEHADIYWAKTIKESDALFDFNSIYSRQQAGWTKGASVFAYSRRDDYREIIEKTKVAPSYLANNYTWGETLFSAKAPEGMPEDAICEEASEDIISTYSSRFVQLMAGRTLREELKSAGLKVEDELYKSAPGLPFDAKMNLGYDAISDSLHTLVAYTYMDILKWDDKTITKNMLAAIRKTVTSETAESFVIKPDPLFGPFLEDNVEQPNVGDEVIARDKKWHDYSDSSAYQSIGGKNEFPIIRWVIEKPREDGTSPDRTRYMTYATDAPDATQTPAEQ